VTIEEQNVHWYKFHRFQQTHEKAFTPKFNWALQAQNKQFIEYGTLMAVDSVLIYKVLLDLYTTVPQIWAATSTVQIRNLKARMPMGFSQRIIDLMKAYYGIDLLNLADDITQTTKNVIQAVLNQAAIDGFGFDEVVRRLQSTELTIKRARLIARTETVAAANAASNIAAQDTGLVMDKIWISARDGRTRPHHRQVNQSIVPMDDRFTVGESLMLFPGDKAGGAAECVQCRCTHAFIPRRDERGRLIRINAAPSNKPVLFTSPLSNNSPSSKPQFVPAKTVSEAAERMKAKGVKFFEQRGYTLDHANASLKAIESIPSKAIPDALGNGKAFAEFTNRPIGRKANEWYGISIDYPDLYANGRLTTPFGAAPKTYQIVGINTNGYSIEGLTARKTKYNEWYQSKFGKEHFFNTNGELTHFHEFGHIYDNKYMSPAIKAQWETISGDWYREGKYDVLKSKREAFAEAFADYFGNEAKRIPSYIKDFFDKNIK
jgi:hypothetical protein